MTDRATSTTLSYVLTLAIAAVLVTGLITAGGSFVEDRREQVIREELKVIGEHVAGNLEAVDRYATASDDLSVARINQTLPRQVTGARYELRLQPNSGDPHLWLNTSRPDVSVQVNVTVQNDVTSETVADGGQITVACTISASACDELEIRNE